MGYRVYADANQTKARMHHDYEGISFPLLGAGTGVVPSGANYLTTATASILSAIALTLAF